MNPGPLAPKASALASCATPRNYKIKFKQSFRTISGKSTCFHRIRETSAPRLELIKILSTKIRGRPCLLLKFRTGKGSPKSYYSSGVPKASSYFTEFAEIRTVLPFFHTANGRPDFLCRSTTPLTAFFKAASALSCNDILFICYLTFLESTENKL